MTRPIPSTQRKSILFWLTALYLSFVFATGGSNRGDVLSLLALRPVGVVVSAIGLAMLTREQLRQYRALLGFALALFAFVAVQLVPLPPALWHMLPGRGLLVEIDAAMGLKDVWRPISMAPHTTWNAFFSLFVPLGALLLALQLRGDERRALLVVLVGLGIVSGLLGLLQVTGARGGSLYLYRQTNPDAAAGVFANRNHQALLLATLFPMLAIYAWEPAAPPEQARVRLIFATAAGLVLVPLLLVTGSRAGFVLMLVGLVSIPFLYRRVAVQQAPRQRSSKLKSLPVIISGLAVLSLGLLTILFTRAQAFSRIMAPGQEDDLRFRVWGPITDIMWYYFPIGSGIGSFVEIFQVHEPDHLLKPTYLNHAHNDWLEVAMTGGFAGVLLILAALIFVGLRSVKAWRETPRSNRDVAYARAASVIALMFALASFADYPLRVPSLQCVAVIIAIWLEPPPFRAATRPPKTAKGDGSLDEPSLGALG